MIFSAFEKETRMAASQVFSPEKNGRLPFCQRALFHRTGRSCLSILGWLCGGFLLVAAAAAGVWWFYWPKYYTATAKLRLAAVEPSLLSGNAKKYSPDEFEIYKNTEKAMLTNRLVLNAALGQEEMAGQEKIKIARIPELAAEDDPVDWLSRNISVSFPDKSEIMKVSIATTKPANSVAIVQAVVNSYMKNVVEEERTRRDKRIAELRNIQTRKEEEVKETLNELKRMARIAGTSETDTLTIQQKNMLDELANLRQQSITMQFNLNRMKAELAALKAAKEFMQQETLTAIEVQMACPNDPILLDFGGQLVSEKQQLQSVQNATNPNSKSPMAKEFGGGRLGRIELQYSARIDQLGAELRSKKLNDVEREIKKLDAQIEIVTKQYSVIENDLKDLQHIAKNIGIISIDVEMRRASVERSQKILGKIADELEKRQIESRAPLRVTIVQQAEVEEASE
jgi:polysaccharide biosynthesis transport protein